MARPKKQKLQKSFVHTWTGPWYDPNNSGWGILVNEHPQQKLISVTVFTYDNNGNQVWLNGAASYDNNTCKMNLYKPKGVKPFNTLNEFILGDVVGSLELTLTELGSLSYIVNVKNEVLNNGLDFSPAPALFTENGSLSKLV